MISFRKQFILILIGVVCLNLFLVYVSFNVLVERYIENEAEAGIHYVADSIGSTARIAVDSDILDVDFQSREEPFRESTLAQNIDRETVEKAQDIIISRGAGESIMIYGMNGMEPDSIDTKEMYEVQFSVTAEYMPEEAQTISTLVQTISPSKSILDMKYIILNNHSQVAFPLSYANEEAVNQTSFILDYYLSNKEDFEKEKFSRTADADSTYYISRQSWYDDYDILMYSDITGIQDFISTINWVLCGLMAVSGCVAVLAGIRMGGGMNRTITSLSSYAKRIGSGDFGCADELDCKSRYHELDQLGKSMVEMAEQLKKSDEKQKTFFQNVSHELRTPLMSIQGYAEGITAGVFDNSKEAAEVILEESREMTDLVKQLLYISRLDNELDNLPLEEEDLRELLTACGEKVAMAGRQAGVEIQVELPEEKVPFPVNWDTLSTAIVNLLDNGIRYAKSKVTLSLEVKSGEAVCENKEDESGEKNYREVQIRVADDGGGIAEDDLPNIFQRFYKGPGGNVGLGLAIVSEIVSAHGGRVTVENRDGAVFAVDLTTFQEEMSGRSYADKSRDFSS